MTLSGKLVLVLGLGESGLAMARWCQRLGARVRVADTRPAPPALAQLRGSVPSAEFIAGDFIRNPDKALLEGVDLIALSPGLSGGSLLVIEAQGRGIPVQGEIELFAQALRGPARRGERQGPSRVIAITGTNGKTTTTALTGHLCRAAGRDAELAGNISPSALTALMARLDAGRLPDVWVLELSSFQLETTLSLNADAATVLNVSEDHLDRYIDLNEYASAKARIFQGAGAQVLNRQDARVRAMALPGRRLTSFGLDAPGMSDDFGLRLKAGEPWLVQGERYLLAQSALPIAGLHNAANALAALALCQAIGLPLPHLVEGLKRFKGLPHRVEKIAEIGLVRYFDDSKGTNVGATVAALSGIGGQLAADDRNHSHLPPLGREVGRAGATSAESDEDDCKIVLIAGGEGKGQDFSPLARAVQQYARAVVLIGRDAPLIAAAIASSGVPVVDAEDMAAAVRAAAAAARPGDAVLLSPACASFDMYRNYGHRAEVFAAAVRALAGAAA
ncbi:MAG TPA: UDP-N-acetylmuramoyl-L-alanine--D-glutamate ligase [Rhodocyclaceae bacterium]|nr:UDP-N-acetylmuramoyl-L-alanine--D-glutamate ligase [Rhodocyclaceae bacterium]